MNKRHILLLHIVKTLEDQGMVFGQDVHTLRSEQVQELSEWANSVRYKGTETASIGQGRLFYQYLGKIRQTYT